MRSVIIFLTLFATLTVSGQPITDIKRVLEIKKINSLKEYIDSINRHTKFSIRWEILRDVVNDYQEGVIEMQMFREPDSLGNVDNFSINLLSDNDNIFFLEFVQWKSESRGGTINSYPSTLLSYIDTSEYKAFEVEFYNAYSNTLNKNELFETSIVYGSSCGFVGVSPEYKSILDSLVLQNNSEVILLWLKSPNTEKQLYAMEGLATLKRKGYKLTDEDKKIIKIIAQKKGLVNTCGGCIYSSDSIKNVVASIGISESHFYSDNKLFVWVLSGLAILLTSLLLYIIRRHRKAA